MTEAAPPIAELLNLGRRVALVTGLPVAPAPAMLNDCCRSYKTARCPSVLRLSGRQP